MSNDLITILVSAFFIGLLGAGHCFAMCGGILAALSLPGGLNGANTKNIVFLSLCYQLGRIGSYTMIGVLAGLVGFQLDHLLSSVSPLPLLRIIAGIMLVLLGFYISRWWRVLTKLEQLGTHLWKYIEPIGRRFLPIDNAFKALLVGMVWGWLPCGLVYSTLALALAQSDVRNAALVMAAFGVGTLPAMWLGTVFGTSVAALIRASWFRSAAGMVMILFGLWSIQIAIAHSQHQHPMKVEDTAPEHSDHHH